MELPTPKNADTPKERKHREQVIVIGTVVLVILTFMMLRQRSAGASASAADTTGANDGNVTPAGSSASGGDYPAWLPQAIASIPGSTKALLQGDLSRLRKQQRRNARQEHRILHLEHEILHLERHERKPHHPIQVTRRAPAHSRHPAQQHRRKRGTANSPSGIIY